MSGLAKRIGLLILVSLVIVATLMGPGCAQEPAPLPSPAPTPAPTPTESVTWKFVEGFAVGHWYTIGAQKMCDLVSKRTDGMFTIELYPSATLYPQKEQFTACIDGLIEMVTMPGAYAEHVVPALGMAGLPLLFPLEEQMYRLLDDAEARDIIERACLEVGLMPLGRVAGFGGIYLWTKDKVETAEDLAGMPIRAAGKSLAMAIDLLGGSAVSISGAEAYAALQRGTVRGQVQSQGSCIAQKIYEVIAYGVQKPAFNQADAQIYVNLDAYNALPKQFQKVLADAIDEVVLVLREDVKGITEEGWGELQAEGIQLVTFSAAETDRWQRTVRPVWDELAAKVGPDGQKMLELALKALK